MDLEQLLSGLGLSPEVLMALQNLQGMMGQGVTDQRIPEEYRGTTSAAGYRRAKRGGYGAAADDTGWSPLDSKGQRIGSIGWRANSGGFNPVNNKRNLLKSQTADAIRSGDVDLYTRAQMGQYGPADHWNNPYEQNRLDRAYWGEEAASHMPSAQPNWHQRANAKMSEWEANPLDPRLAQMKRAEAADMADIMPFSNPQEVRNNPGRWNPGPFNPVEGDMQPATPAARQTSWAGAAPGDYENAIKRQAMDAWAENYIDQDWKKRQTAMDFSNAWQSDGAQAPRVPVAGERELNALSGNNQYRSPYGVSEMGPTATQYDERYRPQQEPWYPADPAAYRSAYDW